MRFIAKLSYRGISFELSKTGVVVPESTLRRWCHLFKSLGPEYVFTNTRPTHATATTVEETHLRVVDECMRDNPELSSVDLQKIIEQRTGTQLSASHIRLLRRRIGWTYRKTKYCQLIRNANKPKRLEWSTLQLRNQEKFEDVIFSDEASFEAQRSANRMYYKKGEMVRLRPKPKHPVKVSIAFCP